MPRKRELRDVLANVVATVLVAWPGMSIRDRATALAGFAAALQAAVPTTGASVISISSARRARRKVS